MKLLIKSQTSTVQPLKFGNGNVISPHYYRVCNDLAMQRLKLIYVSKRGPRDQKHTDSNIIRMRHFVLLTIHLGEEFRFDAPASFVLRVASFGAQCPSRIWKLCLGLTGGPVPMPWKKHRYELNCMKKMRKTNGTWYTAYHWNARAH